jgi:hypothetical protein
MLHSKFQQQGSGTAPPQKDVTGTSFRSRKITSEIMATSRNFQVAPLTTIVDAKISTNKIVT